MRTDRMSARAWLATLLVGSAVLFFIGTSLERAAAAPSGPGAVTPSSEAIASLPAEGGAGEAGEGGATARPATSSEAASGETAPETTAEWRPFGIDLESPVPVGFAIVVSLALAVALLRLASPVVPITVIGFALVFLVFDLLEVTHQVQVAKPTLAVIAIALVAVHLVVASLAFRLVRTQGPALADR